MKLKSKLMKVFNIDDLPENIQNLISEKYYQKNKECIEIYIYDEQYPENEHPELKDIIYKDNSCGYVVKKGYDLISDYFYDNGIKIHDEILIKTYF